MASATLTREQIQRFAATINQGRAAFGLAPVREWQVTSCQPSSSTGCLSARHLLGPIEYQTDQATRSDGLRVGSSTFVGLGDRRNKLAKALGTGIEEKTQVQIPDSILAVTDAFDRLPKAAAGNFVCPAAEVFELRDQFIEAGLNAA